MTDLKRISLSDNFWLFHYGIHTDEEMEDPGIKNQWFNGLPEDEERLKVYVPSTWSYYHNRNDFYHFGTGWYETSFFVPYKWGTSDGKKVEIVFNGANYRTTVWVNGKKVGFHEGGYTKFWFNLTKFLKFGSDNKLVIQVDNRYMKKRIPWFNPPDWMNYGGIARPVYLKLTSQVCIDDYKVTNEIEFEDPIGTGSQVKSAKIQVRFNIKDFRPMHHRFDGILLMTIKQPHSEKTLETIVQLFEKKEDFIDCDMEVSDPHLWSPKDPYLYDIRFQLIDKKDRRELDREDIRWGLRDFKIYNENFYLNNRKIILRGINRHEDHPDVGSSMNPRLIYNDLNILKECNINCIRTSHYPPYESTIELADEMGFLIIEEVPIYRLGLEQYNSDYLMNAHQQLWEMIHRDKNHCSVIAWVNACECDLNSKESIAFMRNLLEMSRDLDPFRYHTIVLDQPLKEIEKVYSLVDFICGNLSIGWYNRYDVLPENAESTLDEIYAKIKAFPTKKPLMISEFGAGAISGFKSFANAHWSENYQYDALRNYIKLFIKKGYVAGSCVWYFQDFRCSPYGSFLDHPKEYNNKGIVDMHRNPKIAFYIVQRMYRIWEEIVEDEE